MRRTGLEMREQIASGRGVPAAPTATIPAAYARENKLSPGQKIVVAATGPFLIIAPARYREEVLALVVRARSGGSP
jgi:hypothetical protein